MRVPFELSGVQFGDWTVVSRHAERYKGHSLWLCRCSCGIERVVLGNNLKRGKTVSCGHISKTAGGLWLRYTSEYDTWRRMLDRCGNPRDPAYRNYGDRGIWVTPRWSSFQNFIEDMGPRPYPNAQLDRIDNDGHYMPDNCRWVDASTNMRNSTAARLLEHDGETLSIVGWAEHLGIKARVLYARLHNGWSVERTLTQPPRKSPTKRSR
jgi:hypothetical protein